MSLSQAARADGRADTGRRTAATTRTAADRREAARVPHTANGYRSDVQGLRALAVLLVLVYHLYPWLLPGGYIGVDVFFVISGFLITGHLASRYARTGRIRVLEFYGRRARRPLPAAVLVLVVTWVGSRLLLPVTQISAAASEIRAAALYVENWVLAGNAVDYLRAHQAPSPVQHYWSLSIEEQFYLLWPLLFLGAALAVWLLARRRGSAPRRGRRTGLVVATLGAAGIVAGSLWYSVHETAVDRAAAYFVTPTRLWELGIGGLLALLYPVISRRIGRCGPLAWLGLGMVCWSAVALSGDSPFPGTVALVPTLGAALLIVAGAPGARWGTASLLARRPAVFVGDISYSLYLWHWPLIVLWLAYSGGTVGPRDGPVLAGAAVLLAWVTKIVVEDPVRRARRIAPYPGRSLSIATVAAVPVLLASVFLAQQPAVGPARPDAAHPGAPALVGGQPTPHRAASTLSTEPPIAEATDDFAFANTTACKADTEASEVVSCTAGDESRPTLTVALIGDSYAGQWSTALAAIAARQHWKLVTVVHDSCPWSAAELVRPGQTVPFTACYQWGRQATDFLLHTVHPDVVLVTARPGPTVPDHRAYDATSQQRVADGMARYWRELTAAGAQVVAIAPTPNPQLDVPDCLAGRTGSIASCSVPRDEAVPAATAIGRAVRMVGPAGAREIDLNDHICARNSCAPVVGNVVVYRDESHLTRTYTLSLIPYLQRALLQVPTLGGG